MERLPLFFFCHQNKRLNSYKLRYQKLLNIICNIIFRLTPLVPEKRQTRVFENGFRVRREQRRSKTLVFAHTTHMRKHGYRANRTPYFARYAQYLINQTRTVIITGPMRHEGLRRVISI